MKEHVGFWMRALAYFIDYMILSIAQLIIMGIFFVGALLFSEYDTIITAGFVMFFITIFAITWLYESLMTASVHQGTLGKIALGMIVVDDRGKRLTFGRSTGRFFAKIISAMILYIGFFMIGWTQKKQGLHDMIAKTYVIKK